MPQCRLTQEEWKLYLDQLNTAVESEDEERIYQAKNLVKNEIREIYIDRYERDGECVLCGEKAGYFGLCKKCWRSLMGNAILRAEGHTNDTMLVFELLNRCCAVMHNIIGKRGK